MPKLIPKRLGGDANTSHAISHKPELLAPAGDWECARAAVENGADAIFFGLDRFNARMRGKNFTEADLPELMAYLHSRGVKGYVTLNTLVFSNELEDATDFLYSIISSGVDAAIVQDVGVCQLIRQISSDFPIHASTQMSVTSEAGVRFANGLGCSVVVLARECSLSEIGSIKEKTLSKGLDMPLEIFVHGALCVAYSGQCLTSESLGGRSANRGECAQACRLPYDLYSDGKKVPLGNRRYLLSPQDLAGLDALPGIVDAGVASLKIEGRLKAPEYVAAVTGVYRKALDEAWANHINSPNDTSERETPDGKYALEMTFSRGLSTGWLEGIDNQKLVHARYSKKRGLRLGSIESVEDDGVRIRLEAPLKAGDGVVFDRGRPDQEEEGGRVTSVDTKNGISYVRLFSRGIDWSRISAGDTLFKTSDPALDKTLRQSFEVQKPQFKRPITATVNGRIGEPLELFLRDEEGRVAHSTSSQRLQQAQNKPLDQAILQKQIGRLGSSAFTLERLDNRLEGECMLPVSELNHLRRQAVDTLVAIRSSPLRWEVRDKAQITIAPPMSPHPKKVAPYLIPYVRNWEQFETVLSLPYSEIYIELEDPKKYANAVKRVREEFSCQRTIWVAPPRIFKSGEDWITKQLLNCGADGFLARNHEHLEALANHRLRGDFSLNIANHLTAKYFKERWKLERLTASYDLNTEQLEAMLAASDPDTFEITLHQHMPMFHMEHCVFCSFLSKGKDFRDCGRPCDKRSVSLKDRVGALHPLKADAGCRNTLFNSRAQTGAEYALDMVTHGASAFRIEFLNETGEELRKTMSHYEMLLKGEISGERIWHELKLINQLGVTRGTLQ